MFTRKPLPLGGWLIASFLAFGYFTISLVSSTILLWQGMSTKGVITLIGTESCGRSRSGAVYSVQFTDQNGQVYESTISQCTYSGFSASVGDSVTIVYLPSNPSQIAPPNGLLANVQLDLFLSILLGLLTLILLPLWIRKRRRMSSGGEQPVYHDDPDATDFPLSDPRESFFHEP
jgi:hypothetical protein